MLPSNKTIQDALPSKVPQITLWFWILKLLTTGMGEAASDFVLSALHSVGLIIGLIGFALGLWVQIRMRTYNPFAYWSAVMMVAVFGTMAADTVHKDFGVPYAVTTGMGVLAVALTFWGWHRGEGTLSIHSITTRRREAFYWLAVSFTFALGTAAGDLTASELHFGFAGSIVFFGIAFAIVMPILYGAMGFMMGAIGALLYNLLAKLIGGFELELDFRPSAIAAPYPIIPPPTPGI